MERRVGLIRTAPAVDVPHVPPSCLTQLSAGGDGRVKPGHDGSDCPDGQAPSSDRLDPAEGQCPVLLSAKRRRSLQAGCGTAVREPGTQPRSLLDAGKSLCIDAQRVGETPQRLPGNWAIARRGKYQVPPQGYVGCPAAGILSPPIGPPPWMSAMIRTPLVMPRLMLAFTAPTGMRLLRRYRLLRGRSWTCRRVCGSFSCASPIVRGLPISSICWPPPASPPRRSRP